MTSNSTNNYDDLSEIEKKKLLEKTIDDIANNKIRFYSNNKKSKFTYIAIIILILLFIVSLLLISSFIIMS